RLMVSQPLGLERLERILAFGIGHFHPGRSENPVDASFQPPVRFRASPDRMKRPGGQTLMPEGYCVKCKAKKEISNAVEETMKNGRKAIKGKCPTCGTVMFKILGGKASPSAPPPESSAPSAPSSPAAS